MVRQTELTKFLNNLEINRYMQLRRAFLSDKDLDVMYDYDRFMCGKYALSTAQIDRMWEIVDETYDASL